MVMLSRLLRHDVADRHGRRARLLDLAVDLSGGDYPPVTRLLVRGPGHDACWLPWDAVTAANWPAGRLTVRALAAARPIASDELDRLVLLRRDVLDALVLDLEHLHATRANDLWLRHNGELRLRGADVSPWAVLRRLAPGLFGSGGERNLLDWKHVEFLRGDPTLARLGRDYHRRVTRLPPAEIARLTDAIPYLHAAELLTLIPDPVAADVLEAMSPERQLQVYEDLDEDQAVRLLALMAPDLAADLLGHLDPAVVQRHLNRLPEAQRRRVVDLLRYPENTAGGVMTNDIISAPASLTVAEARQALRERLMEPDFVYYVYVVDDPERRRLVGVLTLRDFLMADDERRLEEIMTPRVLALGPLDPAVEAARRVAENHFAALPVVSDDGRLLGAVTADAALLQIAPPSLREQAPRVFS